MTEDDRNRGNFPAKLVGVLVLALLLVVFWAQNRNRTTISLYGFDVKTRVWVALAISGFIGFLIGVLVARRGRD